MCNGVATNMLTPMQHLWIDDSMHTERARELSGHEGSASGESNKDAHDRNATTITTTVIDARPDALLTVKGVARGGFHRAYMHTPKYCGWGTTEKGKPVTHGDSSSSR